MNPKHVWLLALAIAGVVAAFSGAVLADPPAGIRSAATATELPPGWTRIEPGGDTTCAHGTPFAFWARPGKVNKLLVFLQGGGGCWSAETCAPGSDFYNAEVSARSGPEFVRGIFDLTNPDNPFRDYAMIYVPSCNGDIYWGNNRRVYPIASGGELVIQHKGFVNASAAVNFAFSHFPAPESLFVTGCSAGSAGSILFAPYLIDHYTNTPVTQLGDSLSFTYHRPLNLQEDYRAHDNFPAWIPALKDIRPGQFTMAKFYVAVANYYPQYTFAQFNTAFDRTQDRFYQAVGGPAGGFGPAMQTALAEIHAAAPNFRTYTAPGSDHCVLPFDRFYTQATANVRFRDWVADLAAGRTVKDVRCTDCGAPATATP